MTFVQSLRLALPIALFVTAPIAFAEEASDVSYCAENASAIQQINSQPAQREERVQAESRRIVAETLNRMTKFNVHQLRQDDLKTIIVNLAGPEPTAALSGLDEIKLSTLAVIGEGKEKVAQNLATISQIGRDSMNRVQPTVMGKIKGIFIAKGEDTDLGTSEIDQRIDQIVEVTRAELLSVFQSLQNIKNKIDMQKAEVDQLLFKAHVLRTTSALLLEAAEHIKSSEFYSYVTQELVPDLKVQESGYLTRIENAIKQANAFDGDLATNLRFARRAQTTLSTVPIDLKVNLHRLDLNRKNKVVVRNLEILIAAADAAKLEVTQVNLEASKEAERRRAISISTEEREKRIAEGEAEIRALEARTGTGKLARLTERLNQIRADKEKEKLLNQKPAEEKGAE